MLSPKIIDIKEEYPGFKTYTLRHSLRGKPGQFVMVWMPGVDEVPMSIGWQTDTEFKIGIANAGDCTKAIHEKIKVGDRLGIRGPFGKGFNLRPEDKKIVIIGGGYGTPPLLNLAQEATKKGIEVLAIIGARTADMLIYEKEFEKLGCKVMVSTDDGSKGCKGFCTNVMEDIIKKHKVDSIYTCGPEVMMVKVAQMARENDINCEVSLERYMKCGFGICGQCCMDDTGIRVCKDGPVLDGIEALRLPEFGKYHRSSSGVRVE